MNSPSAPTPAAQRKIVFVLGAAHPAIKPVSVTRDHQGYGLHPGCPDIPADGADYQEWLKAQNLELRRAALEDEPADHPVAVSYFEGANPDVSAWLPATPAGAGWFMLSITDGDVGPVCMWARRRGSDLGQASVQ